MSQILVIQPLSPLPGETVSVHEGAGIIITVQITLGCGCPTCAGGRWDASRFRVNARITPIGSMVNNNDVPDPAETALAHNGSASEFSGRVMFPVRGKCGVEIAAFDPETGAAGRCTFEFVVKRVKG